MIKLTTFAVMCKAYGGEPSIDLLRSFLSLGHAEDWFTLSSLKTSWKYSPKKPVIYHREQAPMINTEPISVVHPFDVVENIVDSHNISADEDKLSLIGLDAPSYLEEGKRSMVAGKRKVVLVPMERVPIERLKKFLLKQYLCVVSSFLLKILIKVIAHVTPPSWKQYLRGISIEQLCDIHDKAYMRQVVLDNEREVKKDKTYAELEKKCNEALQDLDKNPLVSDMHAEIETLQSRVNGLHSEYSRDSRLPKSRFHKVVMVSKVISDAAIKLIHSDEMGVLIARLVKASIIYDRCSAFKEVAELNKPFVLEEMPGYLPSSNEEYDRAGNDLVDASYPFLAELTVDPHASME
ncbi:hypothetical protein Tco_0761342 [Tanacetum coccineum]